MNIFKLFLKLISGLLGFVIIWVICLALSPVFIMVIGAKYAQEFLAAKKVKKELAPQKNNLVYSSNNRQQHSLRQLNEPNTNTHPNHPSGECLYFVAIFFAFNS